MRAAVAMPWRPSPERLAAQRFCRAWLERALPGAPIFEVDTDDEPYNLAAARNLGVRTADHAGAEVVVIIDADCIIDPAQALHEAIDAAGDGRLHLPFDRQLYMSAEQTLALMGGEIPDGGSHGNGACYVVTPAAYWAVGLSDERFRGWGGEDDGLVAAASTLIGVHRHRGRALSLYHGDACRDVGSERHRPNSQLAQRYWKAVGDPEAMRAILAEPGRWS